MSTVLRCLFGPRLLRLNLRPGGGQTVDYQAQSAERWGDTIISSVTTTARLLLYVSPLVLPWALKQGWASADGLVWMCKFLTGVGIVVAGAVIVRTLGRISNSHYVQFSSVLARACRDYSDLNKKALAQYDFAFSSWPVDYDVQQDQGDGSKPNLQTSNNSSSIEGPLDCLAWLMTHSFGISLVYPGSMALMKMMLEKPLMDGRTKLVVDHLGERSKVVTWDRNEIDTMFVDKRGKNTEEGKTLVICCEGNAGFYEIGIMATPISCGYSTLGWNHPGFYGSSGRPYPDQERLAVDSVMQFAINKLGFQVENIVVMGWSIGGYTSTWLAMNYPDIKGLILDATFDDLLPLAIPRMPASLSPIVTRAVEKFINLNIGEQLSHYSGPLRVYRRSEDEMICTSDGELWSNRGNNLILSVLEKRYPGLCDKASLEMVETLLYTPGALINHHDLEMEERLRSLSQSSLETGEGVSEEERGRLLCFLTTQLLTDLMGTHCVPLPSVNFRLPWTKPDTP